MRTLLAVAVLAACAAPELSYEKFELDADVYILERESGYGSACPVWVQDGRTWFATAKHVTTGSPLLSLRLPATGEEHTGVVIEWESEEHDLALVSVPVLGIPLFKISTRVPQLGERVYVAGYPMHKPLTIFEGIAHPGGRATAQVGPGASGGAILDQHGHLVGIVVRMEPIITVMGDQTRWGPVVQFEEVAPLLRR